MADNERQGIPAVVITGPVGSGKSTTMDAISEQLGRMSLQHAAIDMDYMRRVYPHPEGDPFGAQLGYRNLAAIWPNLQETGVRCVLLAESRAQGAEYAIAMPGTDVTVIRLDVPLSIVLQRLEGRESEITIGWYRHRAQELQGIMERENVGDMIIDVADRTPEDLAREILERLHLLSSGPVPPASSVWQPPESRLSP